MRFFVATVMVAAAAAPLAAQTRSEPIVVLTVYAGTAGGFQMWTVNRQTLIFNNSTSNPPDTARLSRQANPGLALGALFHLFRSEHSGLALEIGFASLGFDDTCTPVAPFQADTLGSRNGVLCGNISARAPGSSMLSATLGATVRAAPRAVVSPYLRLGAGVSLLANSAVEIAAPEEAGGVERVVIGDPSPKRTAFTGVAAGGLTMPLFTGYQFRLELQDRLVSLAHVDGPANAIAVAPTSNKLFQRFVLILGLDIVLEQKRGRRY
jgi:hypothetical protein